MMRIKSKTLYCLVIVVTGMVFSPDGKSAQHDGDDHESYVRRWGPEEWAPYYDKVYNRFVMNAMEDHFSKILLSARKVELPEWLEYGSGLVMIKEGYDLSQIEDIREYISNERRKIIPGRATQDALTQLFGSISIKPKKIAEVEAPNLRAQKILRDYEYVLPKTCFKKVGDNKFLVLDFSDADEFLKKADSATGAYNLSRIVTNAWGSICASFRHLTSGFLKYRMVVRNGRTISIPSMKTGLQVDLHEKGVVIISDSVTGNRVDSDRAQAVAEDIRNIVINNCVTPYLKVEIIKGSTCLRCISLKALEDIINLLD
ncbi:MAG: hypothetical protein LBG13_00990 [Holosporales bacterium]|nr:hypothetical protein [Holosporales bacterium]